MKLEHLALVAGGLYLLSRGMGSDSAAGTPSLPTMDSLQAAVASLRDTYREAENQALAPYQSQLESIPFGATEAYTAAQQAAQQAMQAFSSTPIAQQLQAQIDVASAAVRNLPGQQLAARGIAVVSTGDWLGPVSPANWDKLGPHIQQELLSGAFTLQSGARWW